MGRGAFEIMKDKLSFKNFTNDYLSSEFKINKKITDLIAEAEEDIKINFKELDDITAYNQYKVLRAFQKNRISDMHFSWNTGYGYDDAGRDAIERVYADIFRTEAALVRTQIVNGTHALSLTLSGLLRPDDEIIYISGKPYDTLEEVIGIRGDNMGSLKEFGISYKQVELKDGKLDFDSIRNAISSKTKMVCLQRATGYAWRSAITIEEIKKAVNLIREIEKEIGIHIIFMVDNCYGEFLDIYEPTDVGVDVIAGSLIKNPGGGLALSGGYVTGKKDLIEKIAYRLTCPGIGGECGLTFGQNRNILQGIFIAPKVTNGALKGAMLCGKVYQKLGFEVCPLPQEKRSDIIQSIKLGSKEAVIAFCQGIQEAAPIDSYVVPEPWNMPGYDDEVIMAAGAFVQGSSIELSSDAPIREPYIVYFQGGLTYEHSKFGVIKSLQKLYERELIKL